MTVNVKSAAARIRNHADLTEFADPQERLPYWARSTNPIVRRHLGLYWRTVPPEIKPFMWIYLVWVVIMLASVILPALFSLTMISYLASIMVIPFAMLLYGHVLLTVAIDATRAMQQEFSNNTFELLQATPMSLPQIYLGKVAAAMWRRMDDIVMIAQLTLAFSPPIIFTIYTDFFPMDTGNPAIAPLLTLIAALVALFRVLIEPMMIGVVSVFIGMVVPGRGRSISSAIVLGGFYFLLMNLLSRLPAVRGYDTPEGPVPANAALVILVDFILPLAIPALIIFVILKVAEKMMAQD